METKAKVIRDMIVALLDDDDGISGDAFAHLWNMIASVELQEDDRQELSTILIRADATDGRYYLPEQN